MRLVEEFRRHLDSLELGGNSALVAVSGGPDSIALLDLLSRTRDIHRLALVVAHFDHGIHPDSRRVADDVRALAVHYGLPYEGIRVELGAGAGETLARARRYEWLEATRQRVGADLVFTAHHADDQVETVLMRVLRGSGPAGLAGMSARRGVLVRPLLPFRRVDLEAYVREVGLTAWLDPANLDPRHLRSWIRGALLPMLRERMPDVDANLQRLAVQSATDRAAWDGAIDHLPGLEILVENDGLSLSVAPLVSAEPPLAGAVVAAAARRLGCVLGAARTSRILDLVRTGTSGAVVPLGAGWRAELSFGRLHLVAGREEGATAPWSLMGDEGDGWWGRWHIRWRRERDAAAVPARHERQGFTAWFCPAPLVVRRWVPGERVRPLAGAGRRPVARCLQETRIPRRRRVAWPVVATGENIVWVPGVCRSDALLPDSSADALRVDVEYV